MKRNRLPKPVQSNPASDSIVVDRMCATSKRIPCGVPVFKGLWRGTVIMWAGGPVAQPDMAPFLADHRISETGEHMNQPIAGHAARQLQAASKGINSSLT